MTKEQEQSPKRKKILRITKKAVVLIVVFIGGYAIANLQRAQKDKLLQIETEPFLMKTATLIGIYRQVGIESFRSCEYKVDKLHYEIINSNQEEWSEEVGALVSSILVDGRNCNAYLAKYIKSQTEIPDASLFDGFRHMRMVGSIKNIARTEGELMLWMLDRLNPDYRLTLWEARELPGKIGGELYANNEVRYYWIAVASGDFESGR